MKYLITQKRNDAIGQINRELKKRLTGFTVLEIPWISKHMYVNYFIEFCYTFYIAGKSMNCDCVLSTNSKSVHTHLLPYLTRAPLYTIHFHFDKTPLTMHRFGFFNYRKLFKQWGVIFGSKAVEKAAHDLYGNFKSIAAYCGINHDIFKINPKIVRQKNLLLYVGSFAKRKNIMNTLDAFALYRKKNPQAKFIIVNSYGGNQEKFWRKLNNLGIVPYVELKSNLSIEQLSLLYNTASTFVFPTLNEGFGLPLVEAMACGCPIVTSRGGVHEEVTCGNEFYCDPTSPSDIAEKIGLALQRTKNNVSIAKEYTWENFTKEILSFIK
jgi:glycosyltransferase involved in cell wall biosynthesis